MALDLAGVEKGEVIPDRAAPKSDFLPIDKLLFDQQYELKDRTVKAGKISQQIGFVTRFLNEASQEIKINESRLLKFYQENSTEKSSTENSAEKDLKEDSKFKEL